MRFPGNNSVLLVAKTCLPSINTGRLQAWHTDRPDFVESEFITSSSPAIGDVTLSKWCADELSCWFR
ncbi:hypothetical protein A6X21_16460 [Planctopirus hydrillae]|uniref:Uncharacterized protein n=1 Tax=Planctopirus hydrillae TaxID=1841610 RepID=A0A1C3ET61_9PLAN|nr:hypothetical protein A6X21_16460 [Planctopirus hydrillae]